jgi:hypothetical protein
MFRFPLGQNCPNKYLAEPTSVVTIVFGGSAAATLERYLRATPCPMRRTVVQHLAALLLELGEGHRPSGRRLPLQKCVENLRTINQLGSGRNDSTNVGCFEDPVNRSSACHVLSISTGPARPDQQVGGREGIASNRRPPFH